VDPRAGLDDVEKRKFLILLGLELRLLGSQSLYRLSYPGSCGNIIDLCKLPSKEIECEVVDFTRLTQIGTTGCSFEAVGNTRTSLNIEHFMSG
jgi:hypothetical protein